MRWQVAFLALLTVASTMGTAMADMHNIPPITVDVRPAQATSGDVITIFGAVKDIDPDFMGEITVQILDSNGNRMALLQERPAADGTYSLTITAGGDAWKSGGEYTVRVAYLIDTINTNFVFVPLAITCDAGYELVGNTCEMITCDAGYELVGNTCEMITCDAGYELVGDMCVPLPNCGPGTELVDGVCQIIKEVPPPPPAPEPVTCADGMEMVDGECQPVAETTGGGGCLIATAAFGTELAPQVQHLREIRDDTVMSTNAGMSFMSGFNSLYYAVSPQIADLERENPVFREIVRVAITPMLASLSIMELAETGSEVSVLGTGILVILLNVMMYLVAPTVLGFKAYRHMRVVRHD